MKYSALILICCLLFVSSCTSVADLPPQQPLTTQWCTLNNSYCTIQDPFITNTSAIFCFAQVISIHDGILHVENISAGVEYSVHSDKMNDNSTIACFAVYDN